MREQKWKYIVSTIIIAVPTLLFWVVLNMPSMSVRLTGGMTAQRYMLSSGIQMALLMALHLFCLYLTTKDQSNQNQNKKAFGMIFWIIPFISFFVTGILFRAALHFSFDMKFFVNVFLGLSFLLIGNYMPKCRRNHTLGIRVTWTLQNDENWNATHRFGGKVWVIGGLLLVVSAFLPKQTGFAISTPVLFVMIIAPILYSYLYYRKQKAAGTYTKDESVWSGTNGKIAKIIVIVIFAITALLLFSGSIKISYQEEEFTINATGWSDLTVRYDEIDEIKYLEDYQKGNREMGFGSFTMGMGAFRNQAFGDYTLYAYNKTRQGVQLLVDGEIIVISGTDEQSTKQIYEELSSRIK